MLMPTSDIWWPLPNRNGFRVLGEPKRQLYVITSRLFSIPPNIPPSRGVIPKALLCSGRRRDLVLGYTLSIANWQGTLFLRTVAIVENQCPKIRPLYPYRFHPLLLTLVLVRQLFLIE